MFSNQFHRVNLLQRREMGKKSKYPQFPKNNEPKISPYYIEADNFPFFCEFELHKHAEKEDYETLKSLIEEFPQYVNCVNSDGYTPLAVVTRTIWEVHTKKEKQIMELLLSHGADPMMNHHDGKPIALHAFKNGDEEVLMIFCRYLEDIDTLFDGYTPIHYAITQCECDVAKFCLERGANVHQMYRDQKTLVHVAVSTQNYSLISLLLDYGCDVDAKMSGGNTALHLAVVNNNGDYAVKTLIKYGANVNAQNNQGDTPLNLVAQQHYFNYGSFEHLINAGCNVNIPDYYGFTPLHKISYNFRFGRYDTKFKENCKNFVRVLLRRGADAFALTHYEGTVLDAALACNRLELAEILIKHITPKLFGRYQSHDRMIYSFESHPKFRSIARRCRAEYSKLDRVVPCTNFTYKDLAKNYRRFVKYATNETVANDIQKMIAKRTRLYNDEVSAACTKVLHMAKMLILLTEIFEYVLPGPCIDKILEYINPDDCAETFQPEPQKYNRTTYSRRYRRTINPF